MKDTNPTSWSDLDESDFELRPQKIRRLDPELPASSMPGSMTMTPESPRVIKVKARERGVPRFGCEHLRMLMGHNPETTTNTIEHYASALRIILNKTRIKAQTSKSIVGTDTTSLTSKYLCIQCDATVIAKRRLPHADLNGHQFFVDSRNGGLFCAMCKDFICDPTLEELRVRKARTGTFSGGRKRKHSEIFADDPKPISTNTIETPCQTAGLRGIYNMGSTCFMSVILQSFLHNPLLRNFYLGGGHDEVKCVEDPCLSCGISKFFRDYFEQDTTSAFIAADLLFTSWETQRSPSSDMSDFAHLTGDNQQDAHEFFLFLKMRLHETAPNCREDIMHQALHGQSDTSTTCHHCQEVRTKSESFSDLSLGLEGVQTESLKTSNGARNSLQPLTLQGCLDAHCDASHINYTCENCGHESEGKATQHTSFKRLPHILNIQFKRFEHLKETRKAFKIRTKVQFPLSINMLPYTNHGRSQDTKESYELARLCTYELLSVVVHKGELNGGHYYSYSKVGSQWFMFDDHRVTLASPSQVLDSEAFMLFYNVKSLA